MPAKRKTPKKKIPTIASNHAIAVGLETSLQIAGNVVDAMLEQINERTKKVEDTERLVARAENMFEHARLVLTQVYELHVAQTLRKASFR